MELKRPIDLPSPDVVTKIFKKPRLDSTNPLIHSVPPNIIPIINTPNTIEDFFTDLNNVKNIDMVNQQIKLIIEKFPPPVPPINTTSISNTPTTNQGIMVPFIYPPPPIIDLNKLPYSLNNYNKNKKRTQLKYVSVPPLPFPPKNFMPYPLNSDYSSLTPETVFDVFLQANDHLPKSDMLVASAAGSLTDIKIRANEEAFNFQNYLNYKSRNQDIEIIDSGDDYFHYLQNIDLSDYYDGFDKSIPSPKFSNEFIKVNPQPSTLRSKKKCKKRKKLIYDDYDVYSDEGYDEYEIELPFNSGQILNNFEDLVSENGTHREKRRLELKSSLHKLESFEYDNRDRIYQLKRNQLLTRLKNLQSSKINFSNSIINDEELARYDRQIQLTRDEELLRLKLEMNYELLKSSLIFYQDSNRIYKHLNSLIINKLEKLKVFFEYQRKLFTEIISSPSSDYLDIKHKDAVKLYAGLSDHNFNEEIKNILQQSIDDNLNEDLKLSNPFHIQQDLIKSTKSILSVNDFMPLVTPAEFNIITGDLPTNKPKSLSSNSKKPISIKHHIFKNPLYDRATSGSDSNVSDSISTPTIKRRGRRANENSSSSFSNLPGFSNDRSDAKYTESALLAKIMKNFSGPQGVNPEEYHQDLKSMGISSIWPPLR